MTEEKGVGSDELAQESATAEETQRASPPSATAEVASQLAEVQKQLEEERAKADEYLKHWQRSQADFINYKRRTEQERGEQLKYANAIMALRLLPILDDLERAMANVPSELCHLTWIEGVFLIERKLQAILEQEGLSRIEALGREFDPLVHEAVLFEEGAEPHRGKVTAELQPGYKFHDRVIRPTLVRVGKAEPQQTEAATEDTSSSTV